MFHMCYQPLLELASPGTEASPTEPLYGFANRLQPITSSNVHPQHFAMPQSYPQVRNGYMASATPRPSSAAGKRGGRRPKECEEFDITLSEEEKDKRDKRRLRNKEAAARCRQRRLDLMGSLQSQVDLLKAENKDKDVKINHLEMQKAALLKVIREHRCVLPESLRQSLDAELSTTCVPSRASFEVDNELSFVQQPSVTPQTTTLCPRKRPASEMVSDFRSGTDQLVTTTMTPNINSVDVTVKTNVTIKQEPSFKTADPTLYDVNGRDNPEDEIVKRPETLGGSLSITNSNFPDSTTPSGISLTTPSALNGEYPSITLLDGPTGLTPMQSHSLTQFTGAITPLPNDGQSYAAL